MATQTPLYIGVDVETYLVAMDAAETSFSLAFSLSGTPAISVVPASAGYHTAAVWINILGGGPGLVNFRKSAGTAAAFFVTVQSYGASRFG